MQPQRTTEEILLNSLPTWVKAVAFLVASLGVPTVTVAYFMARDSGYIASPLYAHTTTAPLHWARMESMLEETLRIKREELHIFRQVCRNTSKSPRDLNECDR